MVYACVLILPTTMQCVMGPSVEKFIDQPIVHLVQEIKRLCVYSCNAVEMLHCLTHVLSQYKPLDAETTCIREILHLLFDLL